MVRPLCLLSLACLALAGCGEKVCVFGALNVSPQSATVNLTSPTAGPIKFSAIAFSVNGCDNTTTTTTTTTTSSHLSSVIWSVSDPASVAVSNAQDESFGAVTCLGPTSGPVTVTATLPAEANGGHELVATATLTCN